MTILVSDVMAAVRKQLRDPLPGIVWSDADLLTFANEAQRTCCGLRQDLFTKRGPIPLVAGVLQSIPANGTVFMRLDGNVGGPRVRLVDSAVLDSALLAWPSVTPTVMVSEYCADAKDRKHFSVYPPNNGTGSVVGLYGISPVVLAAPADALTIDDDFETAIKELMLAQCFGFVTPKQDLQRAAMHRKNAETTLGVNKQSEAESKPKYGATPGGA